MKKLIVSLLAATLMAGAAQATVIDFSQFGAGPALDEPSGSSFDVGEYRFTYWYGQGAVFFATNNGQTALGDDQSEAGRGSAFLLSRVDGKSFDVNSITFGLAGLGSDDGADARVSVAPYTGGGTQDISADGQTFTAPGSATYKNVTEFGFDAYHDDNAVGVRSVDVNLSAVTGNVPEPAAWGLMLVGFGLLGTSARRRTRPTITYA